MPDKSIKSNPRAVVLGCLSKTLTKQERIFFQQADPVGFILFERNCETPEQVRKLVIELRSAIGRDNAPILIDQEGGRVQRLKNPNWLNYLSPRNLVAKARDSVTAAEIVTLNAKLIANDLIQLGINVNCAPVIDLFHRSGHQVIGDRAFSSIPEEVILYGKAVCKGFLELGVIPVIKHMPGHGRANEDSHLKLPIVRTSIKELQKTDFVPFRALSNLPWAMTAHVVYQSIDPSNAATHSAIIIEDLIRNDFKFDGVLISDDLGMEALNGGLRERAEHAIASGCDLLLHCSGVLSEMDQVLQGTPSLGNDAARRLFNSQKMISNAFQSKNFNADSVRERLKLLTYQN